MSHGSECPHVGKTTMHSKFYNVTIKSMNIAPIVPHHLYSLLFQETYSIHRLE